MKIYCFTCREWIFNTTENFQAGGPYHGGMFQERDDGATMPDMIYLHESVKGGDLHCPRCHGLFIVNGEIITEHGILKVGQTKFNKLFFAVYTEGEYKGRLKGSGIYSVEPPRRKPRVQDNSAITDYVPPKVDEALVKKLQEGPLLVKKTSSTPVEKEARLRKDGKPWGKGGRKPTTKNKGRKTRGKKKG